MIVMLYVEEMQRFRAKVKKLVNSTMFRNSVLTAILVNTVIMGIEHHQQVGKIGRASCRERV